MTEQIAEGLWDADDDRHTAQLHVRTSPISGCSYVRWERISVLEFDPAGVLDNQLVLGQWTEAYGNGHREHRVIVPYTEIPKLIETLTRVLINSPYQLRLAPAVSELVAER